jgi:hypothetical protein
MRFSTFSSILSILAVSSAFPLSSQPRQLLPTGQTIKQDVINIHNAVLALDTTIQGFSGSPLPTSLIEGTPVLLGVAEIHRVNRAGFIHALAALPFTVQDSVEIIDTVVSTGRCSFPWEGINHPGRSWLTNTPVNVSIPTSIEHLKAKVAAFKEGSLTVVVIASLKLLLYDHDTFSAAVLAKTNPGIGEAKTKEGIDAVANIHNAIQDGISFYEASLV